MAPLYRLYHLASALAPKAPFWGRRRTSTPVAVTPPPTPRGPLAGRVERIETAPDTPHALEHQHSTKCTANLTLGASHGVTSPREARRHQRRGCRNAHIWERMGRFALESTRHRCGMYQYFSADAQRRAARNWPLSAAEDHVPPCRIAVRIRPGLQALIPRRIMQRSTRQPAA